MPWSSYEDFLARILEDCRFFQPHSLKVLVLAGEVFRFDGATLIGMHFLEQQHVCEEVTSF